MLSRRVGYRPGGGAGQFVGRPHHESLKRELAALHEGGGFFLLVFLVAGQSVVVEKFNCNICREDIPETLFDVRHEAVLDIRALKSIWAVEDEGIPVQCHYGSLIEPGLDGGLRQVLPQSGQDHGPDIGHRLHRRSPFLCSRKLLLLLYQKIA